MSHLSEGRVSDSPYVEREALMLLLALPIAVGICSSLEEETERSQSPSRVH